MRWKVEKQLPPANGETKTRQKFAWLPKRINDRRIWLEVYLELWGYTEVKFGTIQDGVQVTFTTGKWMKISERII